MKKKSKIEKGIQFAVWSNKKEEFLKLKLNKEEIDEVFKYYIFTTIYPYKITNLLSCGIYPSLYLRLEAYKAFVKYGCDVSALSVFRGFKLSKREMLKLYRYVIKEKLGIANSLSWVLPPENLVGDVFKMCIEKKYINSIDHLIRRGVVPPKELVPEIYKTYKDKGWDTFAIDKKEPFAEYNKSKTSDVSNNLDKESYQCPCGAINIDEKIKESIKESEEREQSLKIHNTIVSLQDCYLYRFNGKGKRTRDKAEVEADVNTGCLTSVYKVIKVQFQAKN